MKQTTVTLTNAERAEAYAIVASTMQSPGYVLALLWIKRAMLLPAKKWKTCSIEHVRSRMVASCGVEVTTNELVLALAHAGFVAREIDGEASTNVLLRRLPRAGERVDLTGQAAH